MDTSDKTIVVVDIGTHTFKIGTTKDKVPLFIPTVALLVPRYNCSGFCSSRSCVVGDSILPEIQKRNLTVNDVVKSTETTKGFTPHFISKPTPPIFAYPVERGRKTNWEVLSNFFSQVFYDEMKLCPEDCPMMITDCSRDSITELEVTVQNFFETLNIPALHFGNKSIYSLLAIGKTSGLVVDLGGGTTTISPVIDGALKSGIECWEFGGQDLTLALKEMLKKRGYEILDSQTIDIVKEQNCKVALDFETETQSNELETEFELPDGQVIQIGIEKYQCPELLFHPESGEGIHKLIQSTILKLDSTSQTDMLANIVLCGGSSLFPGIQDRLTKEVELLFPGCNIRVIAEPNRNYLAWIGAAKHSMTLDKWTTLGEYDEEGPHGIASRFVSPVLAKSANN